MSMKQDLDQHQQHSDHSSDHYSNPPPQRRPRAAAAGAAVAVGSATTPPATSVVPGKGRKEREKEKERTKLRERHRRAITSRMLAGLRQHGNFPLPARADMNDVLAALAREAGWTVDLDGTTYRTSPTPPPPPILPPHAAAAPPHPPSQLAPFQVHSIESPLSATSMKNRAIKASLDSQQSFLKIDEGLSSSSLDSVVIAERDIKNNKFNNSSPINSSECVDAEQGALEQDGDFVGTPYIPVYIMLAPNFINDYCQLVDPEAVRRELEHLKALHIDGVVVDCWWGIVEGWSPHKYQWSGYRDLFNIVREFKLKLQVVLAFHEYGGKESGDMVIPLPKWILEIGQDNQDIFFTDHEGRRNTECLSWGIDKERVLKGRTGIEVYFDFMRSFRMEFDDLFKEDLISAIEIGLGASGELRFPSHSEKIGWRYPGIGEFQCYDKYMQQNLRKAARIRGHSFWARGPNNAGHYNSRPHETGFFCDRGEYDSYYGRFFLRWYAQTLFDHADQVLSLASLAFEGTKLVVKIPSIYWWYRTSSHAAELTAGYYNPTNQDGYSPVFDLLKKHFVTIKFTLVSQTPGSLLETDEAWSDPEGQSWQILNSAWDRGLSVACQGNFQCHERDVCIRVIETAKPRNDPDRHHISFFTYQTLSPVSMQGDLFLSDLDSFIKSMHGDLLSVDVAV
ncbi:beta-amylase 8 isoform X2 [Phalaenopsis equestris]|uniref:beta-amylase 8 isoform X2 n=1 Tax=Phalaenopsis equestris TaxID=78828 RepID=UPI0009E2A53F|nr:beta-amylase 8 isoform X2 [Phalaenopsis equestris]